MITSNNIYIDSILSGKNSLGYTEECKYVDNIKDNDTFHEYKHDKYDVSHFDQTDFFNRTGSNLDKLIKNLNDGQYFYAQDTLNNINYQIRSAMFSNNLKDDIMDNIKIILNNLENTEYLFIDNIDNDKILKVMNYLKWTKNFIQALSNIDEWEEKMEKEWGG